MKKITCFIASMGSGGAEHQLALLTDMLVNRGYAVDIATFADIADHYNSNTNVNRVRIAPHKHPIVKLWSIFRYFYSLKSDVVISFGQRENFFALLPLLMNRKVKVIAGERNFTIGKPSIYERMLMSCLYRRAQYIVPNSLSQRQYIIEHKPRYAHKVVAITNYTNLAQYQDTPLPHNPIPLIGVFGRYSQQKNYERLALMLQQLKQGGHRLRVEWFGNIYDKNNNINPHYKHFVQLVEKYDIAHMIGLNNHIKDVASVMQQFDAICLPSLHEGWSNALSEAICSGRPMLVSDVSDNSVMVKEGINGFLFDPNDVDSMCNAFVKFLNLSPNQRQEMGRMSRTIAEALFDANTFVEKYIHLIED